MLSFRPRDKAASLATLMVSPGTRRTTDLGGVARGASHSLAGGGGNRERVGAVLGRRRSCRKQGLVAQCHTAQRQVHRSELEWE